MLTELQFEHAATCTIWINLLVFIKYVVRGVGVPSKKVDFV